MFYKIKCLKSVFYRILQYFILILLFSFGHTVEIRTSNTQPTEEFYIAVDFSVPSNSHITAPIGIGKSMAPSIKLTNCKVLDTKYPKAEPILKFNGEKSEYMGFYKDFTVVMKVSIDNINQPIDYDIFYVVCSKGCKPNQCKGIIKYNGKFKVPNKQQNSNLKTIDKNQTTKKAPVIEETKIDKKISETGSNKIELKNVSSQNAPNKNNKFLYWILFGLLGGLILNVMPCVFPVISIKLLSVAKAGGQLPKLVRSQCFAYAAGTISMFTALGLIICIVRLKIPSVGWGFYMQYPQFNFLLLVLFLLCALHFLEIYQFHFPLPQIRGLRGQKLGLCVKSFGNGIFGAITSAVCVGPFLGLPIGNALLSNSMADALTLFISIGIGLASPFIFMGFFPQYVSRFPKLSGTTMHTFSSVLGLLMLLSCTWLISVLSSQLHSSSKLMWVMMSLVIISVLLYNLQHNTHSKLVRFVFVAILTIVGISGYITVLPQGIFGSKDVITWHKYNNSMPKQRPLFLSFSANWCLNCQFNSRVFENREVIKIFNDKKIYAVKCDWTNRDEEISKLLATFGSVSVPFYVYYPEHGEPVALPTMLTKSNLIAIINKSEAKQNEK